jgi:hypothetical protein
MSLAHFWTGISELKCAEGMRHRRPRHLDDREASRDSPPVTLVGHSFWWTTVNRKSRQAEPKAVSQDRSKMPVNGG